MYSQYGEDDVIAAILKRREVSGGAVLDIGAWAPETFSNSRALIATGWAAVLIEPSPGPLQNLLRFYAGHEGVQIIGAAVGFSGGLVRMMFTDDAVSSASLEVQNTWKDAGGYYGEGWVSQITLDDILNQFGGFAVVSIDTEGSSVDVAKHLLALGQRPAALVVEHDNRLVELLGIAEAAGYRAEMTNGTNVVLGLV